MPELRDIIISGRYGRDMEGLIATIVANGIRIVGKPPEPVKPVLQPNKGKHNSGHDVCVKVSIRTPLSLSTEDAAYYTRLLSQSCRYPALGAQEEAELGRRTQQGDKTARDRMIESSQRLVVRIAREYAGQGLDLADLVGAGDLGLIRAVKVFSQRCDCRRGCYLSTYATRLIRKSMMGAVANQARFLSAPDDVVQDLDNIGNATRRFARKNGRRPTNEELAVILNVYVRWIVRRLDVEQRLRQQPLTIRNNAVVDELGNLMRSMEDGHPTPEQSTFDKYYKEQLLRLLETLPEREKKVLIYRQGLLGEYEHTLEEVGTMFQVTRERIRQIEAKANRKLKGLIAEENGTTDEELRDEVPAIYHRTSANRRRRPTEP